MNDSGLWFSIVINLVIVLGAIIGFRRYYRDKPKVDKGVKIAYYGLSYRRKFWRTIYSLPLFLIFIVPMYFLLDIAVFIGYVIFISIVFIIQAYYNYVKWQEEEKSV